MTMGGIVKSSNMGTKVKCALCGDIIQSQSTHDFVRCKCGEIYVDGGDDYLHMGAKTSLLNVLIEQDGEWNPITVGGGND